MSVVRYVRDRYENGAWIIIEYRDGKPVHVWRGHYNGGNHMKLFPAHGWEGVWDGRDRKPILLSIWEIKNTI